MILVSLGVCADVMLLPLNPMARYTRKASGRNACAGMPWLPDSNRYMEAICLYENNDEKDKDAVEEMLKQVPKLVFLFQV